MNILTENMVSRPELRHTGERWIFEQADRDRSAHKQHLARYQFACQYVEGMFVLDCACGAGYGSFMMFNSGANVIGVDISQEAVDYANCIYTIRQDPIQNLHSHVPSYAPDAGLIMNNLIYLRRNALETGFPNDSFDVIVSFETIEHIEEYEQFLTEMSRVLRADGIFLVSTPNRAIRKGDEIGGFHTQEWFIDEFENFTARYFSRRQWFGQLWDGSIKPDLEESDTFIIGVLE